MNDPGHGRRIYRPLLIVEAANPEWPSVPLVGWNIARALARKTDAHIVTHLRNRDAILRAGLVEGVDFTAIDNERVAVPLHRLANLVRGGQGLGWTTVTALESITYYSFEREVWRLFGSRIAAGEFDVVHRITPLTPASQSPIAKKLARLGVPFIIGPLNGGAPWPKSFIGRQHAEKEWLAHVRGIYRLMPHYRSTRRNASAILVGSKHTLEQVPAWAREKCVYMPENGIDEDRVAPPRNGVISVPLKAVFVGRLVPYKGADILIKSVAPFLLSGQLTLNIVGDGPQRPEIEKLIAELKVGNHVRMLGWVEQPKVLDELRDSDFLAFPSVREFGGGVVIEAMARGSVPVVADYAGPSELVDEQCGIKVAFTDEESLIQGMRSAIEKLIADPQPLVRMGIAGQEKVRREYTWSAKADQILKVYDSAIHTAARIE